MRKMSLLRADTDGWFFLFYTCRFKQAMWVSCNCTRGHLLVWKHSLPGLGSWHWKEYWRKHGHSNFHELLFLPSFCSCQVARAKGVHVQPDMHAVDGEAFWGQGPALAQARRFKLLKRLRCCANNWMFGTILQIHTQYKINCSAWISRVVLAQRYSSRTIVFMSLPDCRAVSKRHSNMTRRK